MAVNLYEHQRKAVELLKSGSILVGGVGTGKSRTALAYFYEKVCKGKVPRANSSNVKLPSVIVPLYIITTAKKRDSLEWDEELALFNLTRGDDSYIPVTIDSWNNIKKYTDTSGSFFIFDEQRLVGTGAWYKAFIKISKKNKWVMLTATPGDTWSDYGPVFVANGFYRNITDFRNQHVVYDPFSDYPKIKKYVRTAKLERHRKAIVIPMSYEKKSIRHDEWVKIGYDTETYEFVSDNFWDIFKNEPIKTASILCYVLRRVVNENGKRLVSVDNIMSSHPKVIIFYNFNYELQMLKKHFDSLGILYKQYNGHEHEELPCGDKWAYLVQYTSGCEGWNCVETDTIIFYSQNYSGRVMEQASGRIDRLNSPFTDLFYYHIFTDSKIDKSIKRSVQNKKSFNINRFAASMEFVETLDDSA